MCAATWTCRNCRWSFAARDTAVTKPFGGWVEDMQDIVAVAQENVGCNDSIYGGTVGFDDTQPVLDHTWRNRRTRRSITSTTTPAPS